MLRSIARVTNILDSSSPSDSEDHSDDDQQPELLPDERVVDASCDDDVVPVGVVSDDEAEDDDMEDRGGDVCMPADDHADAVARWSAEYDPHVAQLARAGVFEHHHVALMAERSGILTPISDVPWNKLMNSVHCERFVAAAVDEMKRSHPRCDTMEFV